MFVGPCVHCALLLSSVAEWLHLLRPGHWWREEREGAEGIPGFGADGGLVSWSGQAVQTRSIWQW